MTAEEFVNNCYLEKETQLKEYMNSSDTAVGTLLKQMNLSVEQLKILYKLLDTVLTDTYITVLYALDGETSLGNSQQEVFKIYGEDGTLVSDCGELEAAAYEAFYENKKQY
jgi:hypothetical protein